LGPTAPDDPALPHQDAADGGVGPDLPQAAPRQRQRRTHMRGVIHRVSVAFDVGADPADEFAEILGLAEIAIDRGEADVGHLIEGRQRFHDQLADHVARNIGLTRAFELADDRVDHALDTLRLDRPLAQRDADRARELVAVAGLALRALLEDGELAELDALESGEARRAIGTEPTAPDGGAVVGRA